jgi:creatinine amidohydrolase/Fe(II)-dependent formamide hydrolase-like protein
MGGGARKLTILVIVPDCHPIAERLFLFNLSEFSSTGNDMNATAVGESYRVDLLPAARAGEILRARPAVIFPLGACEPFGGAGAMGTPTVCAEGIAAELSARCRILRAPAVPFGCSTPFISFPGAFGVKPRVFVNMLCEIAGAHIFQGAKRIFAVSAAAFNREPALEAFKRIEAKHRGVRAMLFDINKIAGGTGARIDREDAALMAMAACLGAAAPRIDDGINNGNSGRGAGIDEYIKWKKRGADPQKLRKLFPDGLLLPKGAAPIDVTPEKGKGIFEFVVGAIQDEIDKNLAM